MKRAGHIHWINVPFERSDAGGSSEERSSSRVPPAGPSWKDLEQQRRGSDERKRYQQDIDFIRSELDRIRALTASLITANEERPLVPLQFFNFDTGEVDRLQALANATYLRERGRLESELAAQHQQIEYVKRLVWAPYAVKPIKIHGIESQLSVDNYPLTELEVRLADGQFLAGILASDDLSAHVCRMQSQQRPNHALDDDDDRTAVVWPAIVEAKKHEKFSAIVTKVCDRQLSTSISWKQNFLKYVSVDDRLVDITDQHQINLHDVNVHVSIRGPECCFECCSFIQTVFIVCVCPQHSIVKLKMAFNEMFGKMSRIKAAEMDLLRQRDDRLQRIHDDINTLERLAGKCVTQFEPLSRIETMDSEDPAFLFEMDGTAVNGTQSATDASKSLQMNREQSFYDRALDEMMNGVLEVCWEDELKKDIPMPECLRQQQPPLAGTESQLTANQREQIRVYVEMVEKLRVERVAYIDKLADERANLLQAREHQIRQVNRCIENISKSRIQAQFAIGLEQMKICMCTMHRTKWLEFVDRERSLE